MGYVLAAAAVIGAAGAGMSASGAAKNADAMAKAQKDIKRGENKLYKKWDSNLNTLITDKTNKLFDIGNIFERFQSTGVFGEGTETLDNLRKAQSDFSKLAAGDFSGFDDQIRKTLSDYSIATIGSGAPIGAYEGLAADAMLNYRLQGIQTTQGIGDFIAGHASTLLGTEFGIMDQGFQVGYELDRSRQNADNAATLGQAQTVGVSQQAWGGALQTTGSLIASAYTGFSGQQNQKQSLANQQQMISGMQGGSAQVAPTSLSSFSLSQPSVPNYTNAGYSSGYPDNIYTNNVPLPRNEDVYNTVPYLPGDDIGVLQPLDRTPTTRSTSAYASAAASNYVSAMASPFSALYSLGAQIASGNKK